MAQSTIGGDLVVNGTLYSTAVVPSGPGISNVGISAGARIAANKLLHRYNKSYAQVRGTAATSERRVIHEVWDTETIVNLTAGVTVACGGAATITIQLKKNGGNILTSAITIDSTTATYNPIAPAGFTSTALTTHDVLEIDVTATAGGGTLGQGLYVQLVTEEA